MMLQRMTPAVLAVTIGVLALWGAAEGPLAAGQDAVLNKLVDDQRLPSPPGDPRWRNPPTLMAAATAGSLPGVIWNWRQGMGMLRGIQEIESIGTLEVRKSTGTIRVEGQPCTLSN